MKQRRRRSFLERAEATILEHIDTKYQKAIAGVYRLGFNLFVIGVIGVCLATFLIYALFAVHDVYSVSRLITCIVMLMSFLGLIVLGAHYCKMKLEPALALGWAIILNILSLIACGFLGVILVGTLTSHLESSFSLVVIYLFGTAVFLAFFAPFSVLLNTAYYLFYVHRHYSKWYKGYAKRHHLKQTQPVAQPKNTDFSDDDL